LIAALDRARSTVPKDVRVPFLAAEARRLKESVPPLSSLGGICVYAVNRVATAGSCTGASVIGAGGFGGFYAGSNAGYVYGIAPDGVATVRLHFPPDRLTARVVANIFVARGTAPRDTAVPRGIVFLGANGQELPQSTLAIKGVPSYGFASGTAAHGATRASKNSAFCRQNPKAC
jgi:hypothetical protein